VKDCAWWASLTMADARAGLDAVRDQLQMVDADGVEYWAAPVDELPPRAPAPTVLLLQGYDEYTVGYAQSKPLLNLDGWVQSFTDRPLYNGVIVLDSQVIGPWKRSIAKDEVVIDAATYRPLDGTETRALHEGADHHGRFLGVRAALRLAQL
ncbi:MAG: DNA glycosylase AlkZ-like family protein, partial [Jiangellaceae bacterium]